MPSLVHNELRDSGKCVSANNVRMNYAQGFGACFFLNYRPHIRFVNPYSSQCEQGHCVNVLTPVA